MALGVFDFLVVEEADGGTAPYYPVPIILKYRNGPQISKLSPFASNQPGFCPPSYRTSRLVTGFSSKERCVSLGKFRRGSRSASSAKLFDVRIREVRFGNEFASVDCMLLTLLRARRRVRNRGESGKLERAVMSLSVKSMASWSYSKYCSAAMFSVQPCTHAEGREYKGRRGGRRQTFATPKFSIAGILCPVILVYDINGARLDKV